MLDVSESENKIHVTVQGVSAWADTTSDVSNNLSVWSYIQR